MISQKECIFCIFLSHKTLPPHRVKSKFVFRVEIMTATTTSGATVIIGFIASTFFGHTGVICERKVLYYTQNECSFDRVSKITNRM